MMPRDDADVDPGALEHRALLDVELQVPGERRRIAARRQQPFLVSPTRASSETSRSRPPRGAARISVVSSPVSAQLPRAPTRVPSSSVKSIASSVTGSSSPASCTDRTTSRAQSTPSAPS